MTTLEPEEQRNSIEYTSFQSLQRRRAHWQEQNKEPKTLQRLRNYR